MGELLREGEIREVNIDSIKPSKTLMRSVDSNKVKQLADSIAMFGLRHPVTISDDNYLISGNHRVEAVKSLGKKTIRAEIVHVSGLLARILMVEENLIRADLTSLEQAEYLAEHNKLLIELGQRAPVGKPVSAKNDNARSSAPKQKTTKEIAKEMGMAERTLQEKIQIASDIDQSARDKLRGTDIADNKSELLRLAKVDGAEDQNAVVDSVIKGDCKTIKEAVSTLTRNKQRKEFADLTSEVRKLPDTVKLFCKDFFEVEGDDDFLKHNSVDAIITDPPYVDEWKENWSPFLGIAADILKPGGFLITYVGHIRLPEFFEALAETQVESGGKISKNNKLEFFWINALEHTGSITAVHARSVQCGYKPIVIAFKPPMKKPYKYFNDLMKGSGKSKSHHDWEQSVEELIPLFDAFTKPGDLVLDPFAGSFTTAVASKMTARRFVGYDTSQENVDIGIKRILELESK
jgi:ParB-like chromosome segregation protein Spo0J